MVGELTIILMDNSKWMIGDNLIPWFINQSEAIELYCKRKLQAHPDNLVGISVMGEGGLHELMFPTNDFKDVQGAWRGTEYRHLNKRIVVFAGGPPLYFADKHLKPVVEKFKQDKGIVIDVVDFFPVLKKSKAQRLKRLVACMNEQTNDVTRVGHYFRVPDASVMTTSISDYLSNSLILPPIRKKNQKKRPVDSAQIREKKLKRHHGQIPVVLP